VICLGVLKVIVGMPTLFQCATASSIAAPWMALVEWLTVTTLPATQCIGLCREEEQSATDRVSYTVADQASSVMTTSDQGPPGRQ
jgi:hypothetical protein